MQEPEVKCQGQDNEDQWPQRQHASASPPAPREIRRARDHHCGIHEAEIADHAVHGRVGSERKHRKNEAHEKRHDEEGPRPLDGCDDLILDDTVPGVRGGPRGVVKHIPDGRRDLPRVLRDDLGAMSDQSASGRCSFPDRFGRVSANLNRIFAEPDDLILQSADDAVPSDTVGCVIPLVLRIFLPCAQRLVLFNHIVDDLEGLLACLVELLIRRVRFLVQVQDLCARVHRDVELQEQVAQVDRGCPRVGSSGRLTCLAMTSKLSDIPVHCLNSLLHSVPRRHEVEAGRLGRLDAGELKGTGWRSGNTARRQLLEQLLLRYHHRDDL
mmetsp:Transcript_67714/g.188952  ORF Transcript_67714/g.188952 Transcript_67714/m.188952 type:complete len:326 (-) Transcript_67714:362-1339(-)